MDGPFLKFANIGEPITHVWKCDPSNLLHSFNQCIKIKILVAGGVYGVLIHSCFVDDGHGNRFELVDDRG